MLDFRGVVADEMYVEFMERFLQLKAIFDEIEMPFKEVPLEDLQDQPFLEDLHEFEDSTEQQP